MKNSLSIPLLLILVVLIISSIARFGKDNVVDARLFTGANALESPVTQSVNATATFGAGQFQLQLTAVAAKESP